MRLEQTVTINAPIEAVFDGWADLARASEHQRPTIDRTKLTDGPVGAGTRFAAVDRWPGRTVAFEMEITQYERPYSIAARWEEPMNGSWLARFEDSNGSTLMSFETTIEPGGLMGLLSPFMRPWAGGQLSRGLSSFRDWVEVGSTEGSP